MLPALSNKHTITKIYLDYLNDLSKSSFAGEIRTDYAARLSVATDNSIYQVIPQAILYPRTTNDIHSVLAIAATTPYQHTIKFSARGGGTGTNGQSLSAGIIIDCSKYMREIIDVNLQEKSVRVQPGVVLDQLNEFLQPMGYYFAPQVSTSNRATLGGMINTDACGNGSKLLGRTSDHVLELTCVASDGRVFSSNTTIHFRNPVADILKAHDAEITARFKNVPRTLNGYNLGKANTNPVNLNYLLSGSEGTLAIVSECKLQLTPLPKYKKCILIKYAAFDDALRATELALINPLVIETIDEKLLSLARKDFSYPAIQPILDGDGIFPQAINLVELVAESETGLSHQITTLTDAITKNKNIPHHALGFYIADTPSEVKLLWNLRKKSVGLISQSLTGKRRPIPFIEDTAVPPEKLADYIAEFKNLLDSYHLTYGMYGHVDAGCIHIRPALDMQDSHDALIMETLSKRVVELLEKYQGVMWGEHGKGYRSEFSPYFFGDKLDFALRQIKQVFDPDNRLNPGKIAVPLHCNDTLVSIHQDFRAQFDKTIPDETQTKFSTVMACNGNAACFNFSTQDTMCPSYKVTGDRVHSPKGRAVLMREWLRQLSVKHFFPKAKLRSFWLLRALNNLFGKQDFSKEVYASLNGCFNCKACATQCPLSIDVPDFKSRFLEIFHSRYLRPWRDFVIARVESIARLQSQHPYLFRVLLNPLSKLIIKHTIGLEAIPTAPNPSLRQLLAPAYFDLSRVDRNKAERSVILLQDAFTSFYEPARVVNMIHNLEAMGFSVHLAPFFPSYKGLHVKGFLKKFKRKVKMNIEHLEKLHQLGLPLVGIDPSITLTYRDEYRRFSDKVVSIALLQEWLVDKLPAPRPQTGKTYYLLSHCTEKALCATSETQWQTIFSAMGHKLIPVATGCCGMAGTYGHETEHVKLSADLFALSWEPRLRNSPQDYLATGFSCRSQAKRFGNINLLHPLEVIYS